MHGSVHGVVYGCMVVDDVVCMVIGDVVMHGIWGLGVVWLVMVGRLLVWYHHT